MIQIFAWQSNPSGFASFNTLMRMIKLIPCLEFAIREKRGPHEKSSPSITIAHDFQVLLQHLLLSLNGFFRRKLFTKQSMPSYPTACAITIDKFLDHPFLVLVVHFGEKLLINNAQRVSQREERVFFFLLLEALRFFFLKVRNLNLPKDIRFPFKRRKFFLLFRNQS